MLEIAQDKVAEIVMLARDRDRYGPELHGLIDALTLEEQRSLVALMWIGRGSFEAEELEAALKAAAQEASTPTESYLTGTPHLAENLEAGAELLGLDVSTDALVG